MKAMRGIQSLPHQVTYDEMDSPVGTLTIITSLEGLHAVLWETDHNDVFYKKVMGHIHRSYKEKTIVQTKRQLREYFEGTRKLFDLPLVIKGTDFQRQCWQQLLKIPYATTLSYAEQAKRVGDKNKARAVGMANGLNAISIVIPCHRVIGSNGQLVGFGGGLASKQWLIEHEVQNR